MQAYLLGLIIKKQVEEKYKGEERKIKKMYSWNTKIDCNKQTNIGTALSNVYKSPNTSNLIYTKICAIFRNSKKCLDGKSQEFTCSNISRVYLKI